MRAVADMGPLAPVGPRTEAAREHHQGNLIFAWGKRPGTAHRQPSRLEMDIFPPRFCRIDLYDNGCIRGWIGMDDQVFGAVFHRFTSGSGSIKLRMAATKSCQPAIKLRSVRTEAP